MPSSQVTNNDNAVYTTSNGAPVARPYAAERVGTDGPLLLQGSLPLTNTQPTYPPSLTLPQISITLTSSLTSTESVFLSVLSVSHHHDVIFLSLPIGPCQGCWRARLL